MNNALHQAAYDGDIVKIQHLILNQGYNPNQLHSEDNTTPLMAAAKGGHLEAMQVLVRLRADLYYKSENTPSLWYWAASSHNWPAIADYLISAEVQFFPNELSADPKLPLLWFLAGKKFWSYVQNALLFFDRDINAAPEGGHHKGKSIPWLIAATHQYALFDFILQKYPEINIDACPTQGESNGMSILWIVAYHGKWDILEKLITRFPHANINAMAQEGKSKGVTVLWIAAQHKQWALVKEIMNKFPHVNLNANPVEGNRRGMTVLWLAAKDKQWTLVKEIIEKFPQASIDDYPENPKHKRESVLRLAIADNQWELVEYMLTKSLEENCAVSTELVLEYVSILRILARVGRLDLALLILESRKFSNIDLELLTETQNGFLIMESFLQLALENNDKFLIRRLISNLQIRELLELHDKTLFTRKRLDLFLVRYEEKLIGKLFNQQIAKSEAEQSIRNLFRQSAIHILNLFDSLETIWNLSSLSYFNIYSMPDEIRLSISQNLIEDVLSLRLKNSFMKELLNFFIESHIKNKLLEQDAVEESRQFCSRLATLAFRKWRHEHMDFIYKVKNKDILRVKINDYRQMVYDRLYNILGPSNIEFTFNQHRRFLGHQKKTANSSTMQKHIIDEIARLEPSDFNPTQLDEVIGFALKCFGNEGKFLQNKGAQKRRRIEETKSDKHENASASTLSVEINHSIKKRKYSLDENQSKNQKEQTLGKEKSSEVESEKNSSFNL
ncbi:ankyrin repeat domain-containing protein [Legionella maceachernii]|uniref:Ankyrin repeats (3 copies) n=1 Tax=Legionella maceachernii TaxID=466 RepID=A0A0W0WBK7_9GAMM|nr:ankyrin repeat domain-containing protein [Legionella maceachernii]KTD29705.1 Ankyrin repeats (3 copies) [Legionella maceachernii]SKA21404.1 Ankyrin repeat-containing protein [Legionella maceachernii]SUP02536.1 Ankyrin repeats (3 copies) [Legionella maceachernii]